MQREKLAGRYKTKTEDRDVTLRLYGGDQEMRIRQEIVLGMGGTNLLTRALGLNPTIYHMNEGHSAFLILELIKNIIRDKQVSFDVARDIASSKTVFTTHTPVPAGNDIFPLDLVDKYFKDFWPRLGLDREEFLRLGMKPSQILEPGFNMGILALKVAGKKNGVSKLHGAVSRELFGDVFPIEVAVLSGVGSYVDSPSHGGIDELGRQRVGVDERPAAGYAVGRGRGVLGEHVHSVAGLDDADVDGICAVLSGHVRLSVSPCGRACGSGP